MEACESSAQGSLPLTAGRYISAHVHLLLLPLKCMNACENLMIAPEQKQSVASLPLRRSPTSGGLLVPSRGSGLALGL
ncbi:hypothetical protein Micbo1qcDRAFT_164980 [Microdochium bolleyi]|uniref:Uncharacterized protein n=1 Tax=Microdochium bolleyi TaxID=196109 RepID=A0A136IXK5_9PEZI|nr:hypothetical protein Micbo1qcDRAFT_164980 [Microdochium bolleyi]